MKCLLAISLISISISTASLLPCPGLSADENKNCGRCHSTNDPHISTFDGVAYDQHTDGCFKYVTQCPESNTRTAVPFEICGCHKECVVSSGIRCIGDVSISFFDSATTTYNIEIKQSNPSIAVDTISSTSLTAVSSHTFDVASGHLFEYSKNVNQHIFKIFGGSPSFYAYISYRIGYLEVFLDETYFQQQNTCGLCGLFDSNPNNDFTGSDYAIYLNPTMLSWPITPLVVDKINDFADTYVCGDDDESECYGIARDCCESFWLSIAAEWENEIVPVDEFKEDWLLGCIVDACALTNNAVTEQCQDGFQFALQIGTITAGRTYQ
eukprot:UN01533